MDDDKDTNGDNSDDQGGVVAPAVDASTARRFKSLSVVGKALGQRSNDSTQQTDFYLAKDAINEFRKEMDALGLDAETLKGMHELLDYLNMKIDKRLNSNVHMTPLE